MIAVILYWNVKGEKDRVGKLELFGVPVGKTDNRSLVEVEMVGQLRAQFRLTPAGIVSKTELGAIADSLCRDEVEGRTGRYDWEVEEPWRYVAPRGRHEMR